jgi:hypothetical protein
MTSIQIKEIIQKDLRSGQVDNGHGINGQNISDHLVEPLQTHYTDMASNSAVTLWTVLEEIPDLRNGYKITYDENTKMFGLGVMSDKNDLVYLGPYGNFLEALNAM